MNSNGSSSFDTPRVIAVALGLIVVLGAGGTLFFFAARKYASASKNQPKNDLIAMHPIAEKWISEHPGDCPTVVRLRAEKEISASSKIEDPWGTPYRIRCEGASVRLSSDGPDRQPDTNDDIRYP